MYCFSSRLKVLLAAVLVGASTLVNAAFPEKPLRLVVPFPPGGATDLAARTVAKEAEKVLGQPIIVDNRPGATGLIATEFVAKAPADGYTLLLASSSHTVNPYVYRTLPFDTAKAFVSIAMIAETPGVLVIHPSLPVSNFKEFIEFARKSNPPLFFGTSGPGTFSHLTVELLKSRAGIQMSAVPYKGTGPGMTDLIAGVYPVRIDVLPSSLRFIPTGKIKALAVTSAERIVQLPDVPTIAELGFPGFDITYWMAVLAPAGTPKEIVSKLERAFIDPLKDKDVAAGMTAAGLTVLAKPASYVDELIARELAQWPPIVKSANIQITD